VGITQVTSQYSQQIMLSNVSTADIRAKHQEAISLDQKLHNLRFERIL
jgi:hypothetical protein